LEDLNEIADTEVERPYVREIVQNDNGNETFGRAKQSVTPIKRTEGDDT
jgi:hypothetical protein